MGPRGEHSRDEFRALVVEAAEDIARQDGLRGLGMRRLAAAIGYAPNSIYSAIGGLDEIVLLVNARTLTRLRDHLAEASRPSRTAELRVRALAHGYLGFVMAEPRLWSLLFEHVLSPDAAYPDWYRAALNGPLAVVDDGMAVLVPEAAARRRLVVALWASLHGLASLAASGKLVAVTLDAPGPIADALVGAVIDGLRERSAQGGVAATPQDPACADAASGAGERMS